MAILFVSSFNSCKKNSNNNQNGNGSNTTGFIDAIVNGVQYNCNNQYGAPSFSGTWYGSTYSNSSQLPNNAFGVTINNYTLLNGVKLPYTFTNNYNGPGIEISFYHNQSTSPTQTAYICNNWAEGLSATITSISNNTIEGTFSGSFSALYAGTDNIQNGSFSLPYNP